MFGLTARSILASTSRRAASFQNVLQRLQHLDFQYKDSQKVADRIAKAFQQFCGYKFRPGLVDANEEVIINACWNVNLKIRNLHPIAGLILRSTNARNSFEAFDALKRIATRLLGADVLLVVSSEWAYVPFTYPGTVEELPDVVFIGLPAVESGNSLFLPLAGHELGHAVWRKRGVGLYFWREIEKHFEAAGFKIDKDKIVDQAEVERRNNIAMAKKFAIRQTEELFSDFIGLILFGPAYLHTFFATLAPGSTPSGISRDFHYPHIVARSKHVISAAKRIGIEAQEADAAFFRPVESVGQSPAQEPLEDLPDQILGLLADEIFSLARRCVPDDLQLRMKPRSMVTIRADFLSGRPSNDARTLAEAVNGGWFAITNTARRTKSFSAREGMLPWLDEVLFKTIEVIEYRKRTSKS